jgi:hypothetical protein
VSAASRTARLTKQFPARWIDVAADAATAHDIARAVLVRRRYRVGAAPAGGVLVYEYGTRLGEFIDDMYSLGLIAYLFGRPTGYGRVAVFTEAVDGGTRLTVSLVTGRNHARSVREVVAELIHTVAATGLLVQAGEPFSGVDLPSDSPGQPVPGYRRRQERKTRKAARQV